MSYKRISPQPVNEGGTGAISLTGVLTGNGTSAISANAVTQHGVVLGGSSNAVSSLGVATTGTILAGNTGADPSFTATPTVTSITFGAGNALSTYTEQTSWTPTVSGSSAAGVGTYNTQAGYYTRIGNMIFAEGVIDWSAHTGTGNLLITNLPFTCRNSANYSPEGVVNTQNINLPGGVSRTALGSIQPGTSQLDVYVTTTGANSAVALGTSGNIHFTITYLT